jgi:hypothetical protein
MRPLTQRPTEPQWRRDLNAKACIRMQGYNRRMDGDIIGSEPPLDALEEERRASTSERDDEESSRHSSDTEY